MNSYQEDFKKFIKAVSTGPKGNRDLNFAESEQMMGMILSGELTESQISAFLIGWRLKPETVEEYKGALSALEKATATVDHSFQTSFELGFPYDGKNDSPYLFPLCAQFLKEHNVKLVICGDFKVPSKEGVTVKELMEELHSVDNVSYYDRSRILPQMSRLSTLRNQLGLRTALNTLEKFSGIENSLYGATGVFHKPYVAKYEEIFKEKMRRFALVSANEGAPELVKKGRIYLCSELGGEELTIDPQDFGIAPVPERLWNAQEMAAVIKDPDKNYMKLAALNAAFYLYTAQKVEKWDEAYSLIAQRYL